MPRVPIPLAGQDYRHTVGKLSSQVSQNWYVEENVNSRNQYVMRPTPGLLAFAELGGADRGLYRFNEELFAVSGNSLFEIAADGTTKLRGTIGGEGRCIMADDGRQLVIVTGGPAYIYTVEEGVKEIQDGDLVNPTSVAYLNSQFIFDNNNGSAGEFVTSELLTTEFNINGLDFATAEAHPDDITRIISFQQTVWMFGGRSLEIWYNSGVGRPPFDRLQSGVRPYGLMGRHAAVATDEYVYWLDEKRTPRRSTGGAVENIGNPALGAELAEYDQLDDCIAMTWQQDHQTFVAFTFPDANKTWCFHEPTGTWFNWAYGTDGARTRASSIVNAEGVNFAADHSNGKIYRLDPCTPTDDGEVIQRRRIIGPLHSGVFGDPGMRMFFDSVEWLFTWDPCVTEIAQRIEPIGTLVAPGVCGEITDLTMGELLAPTALWYVPVLAELPNDTARTDLADTEYFCFTAAFTTDVLPGEGNASAYDRLYLFSIYDDNSSRYVGAVYMDTDGYIQVRGTNSSGTEILSATITNDGGSFADSNLHVIAFVFNMTATNTREVWVDGARDLGTNVTYNTYTTGEDFNWSCGGGPHIRVTLGAGDGGFTATNGNWPSNLAEDDNRACGYVSFSQNCTLVPRAIWDANGWVRDPRKDFTGWYTAQPWFAFGSGPFQHCGAIPTTDLVPDYVADAVFYMKDEEETSTVYEFTLDQLINGNIGGTITAEDPVFETLPPSTPEPAVEIVSPYYNKTGTFFDLGDFTQTPFATAFGVAPNGADVEVVLDTPVAIPYTLSESGYRVTILDTNHANESKLWITDDQGVVLNSSNAQVTLATGTNRYLVVASDTGKLKVEKFDQNAPVANPNDPQLRQEFAAFWGEEQDIAVSQGILFGPSNPKFPPSAQFSIPVYKAAGGETGIRIITITGSGDGIPQYAMSATPGVVSGTGAIESTLGANGGYVTLTDANAPPGWYYFNVFIKDFAPGQSYQFQFAQVF